MVPGSIEGGAGVEELLDGVVKEDVCKKGVDWVECSGGAAPKPKPTPPPRTGEFDRLDRPAKLGICAGSTSPGLFFPSHNTTPFTHSSCPLRVNLAPLRKFQMLMVLSLLPLARR